MGTQERWKAGLAEIERREQRRGDERNAYYDQVAATALHQFDLTGRVLDVGCGSKWARRFLPECDYVGVDPRGAGAENGIAEDLKFPDASFDGVLCYSVLQHVQNPGKALEEITRVLKPGGTVGILVPIGSKDPVFIHRWETEDLILCLISRTLDVSEVESVPGMYPEDGSYLLVTAVRV